MLIIHFVPLIAVILIFISTGIMTGVLSRSQSAALQYWRLHPWRIFWLSYAVIFCGLLLWTVSGGMALVVMVPGFLLMVSSAIQGLRVSWMRSRKRALTILLIASLVLILPGLLQGGSLIIFSSKLFVIVLWIICAWMAEVVSSRKIVTNSAALSNL